MSSPLDGFSVLVTASRRTAEWAAAFARQGAHVTLAPTLSIEPLPDLEAMLAATRELIADPPQDVVVTTAIGWRGWQEAAETHGLEPQLSELVGAARVWARGPKVRGALHGAGLADSVVEPPAGVVAETGAGVVSRLLAEGVQGRRIAVQLYGSADLDALEALRGAGADVVPVPVYRWGPAPDPAAVDRAVGQVCTGGYDAAVFASAPGVRAFLDAARRLERYAEVLEALRGPVVPAAVGPVTAAPLREVGLEPVVPERFRLGATVRVLAARLAEGVRSLALPDGGCLELRGRVASVDGESVTLTPAQLALLRRLSDRPGEVVAREQLLDALPGTSGDGHAVEVTVARLRAALPRAELIQTVVKRGYRLAVSRG
ncbi:uroporphyrinogen-III synthase [Spongisporangium articulatum]|uniref:Uroporphyrinogen-III synthase n=1 Tax=Spongisporangium articulatum TaxID=3362603 RepID=A0ABW8AJF9_9ACTN